MTRSTRAPLCLIAFATLAASPAFAQASGASAAAPRALVVVGENLMAGDSLHIAAAARGRDPNALMAGDVVHYHLTFTNITTRPIKRVVFDNALPFGLRYQEGTAAVDRDQVAIRYSIDRGKTYSATPMIDVDGKGVLRPATAELFTHIRWAVRGAVLPGASVHAEFRAQFAARRTGASAK